MTAEQIAEIKALEDKQGRLTPEQLVEAAANPESTLHDLFDWQDVSAAASWRLAQAREIIRRVKIELVYEEREIRIPAYVRNPELPPEVQGYISMMRVAKRRSAADMMRAELAAANALLDRCQKIAIGAGYAKIAGSVAGIMAGVQKLIDGVPQ
jgi:hypothetical protein